LLDDFYLNREIIRLKEENELIRKQLANNEQSKHLTKKTMQGRRKTIDFLP